MSGLVEELERVKSVSNKMQSGVCVCKSRWVQLWVETDFTVVFGKG